MTNDLHHQLPQPKNPEHPASLLPWRSCRTILDGRLLWVPPGAGCDESELGALPASGMWLPGRRRRVRLYPTPAQALDWMMGGDGYGLAEDEEEDDDDSGDESGSSEGPRGGAEAAAASLTSRLRLWAVTRLATSPAEAAKQRRTTREG